MTSIGQKLRENWGVIFALAVALYLALGTLNFGALVPDVGFSKPKDPTAVVNEGISSAVATTTLGAADAGNLTFKVKAVRIVQSDDGFQARVTLDVTNNGSGITKFSPQLVTISRNGGGAVGAQTRLSNIEVSPHLSQIIPLSFNVNATPGATYRIAYAGTTLFNGSPT